MSTTAGNGYAPYFEYFEGRESVYDSCGGLGIAIPESAALHKSGGNFGYSHPVIFMPDVQFRTPDGIYAVEHPAGSSVAYGFALGVVASSTSD